jgi:signal transduction histidine kinase
LTHLDDVAGLADLPVELVVDGDVAALPDSVSATGYRLVQEALTNVRRHAGPVGRVAVVLRVTDRDVSIAVTDDGRGLGTLRGGDGFGIVGMRERIAAVGGSFDAGPRPGGGWHVRATMPIDAGAGHRLAPGIAS